MSAPTNGGATPRAGQQERPAGPAAPGRVRPGPAAGRRAGHRGGAGRRPGPRRAADPLPGRAAPARPAPQLHPQRQVQGPAAPGGRRDGPGLPLRARRHAPPRGGQAAPARPGRRPRRRGALPPRGPGGRPAAPPQHRHRPRRRPGRRPPLPGDGVRRRPHPAPAGQGARAAAAAPRPPTTSARRRWGCSTPTSTAWSTATSSRSNLLVDRAGTVKVLDLGLARFFHDEADDLSRRHEQSPLGTTDYMAPEQARGQPRRRRPRRHLQPGGDVLLPARRPEPASTAGPPMEKILCAPDPAAPADPRSPAGGARGDGGGPRADDGQGPGAALPDRRRGRRGPGALGSVARRRPGATQETALPPGGP